jgi:hypothetical protein
MATADSIAMDVSFEIDSGILTGMALGNDI